MKTSFALPKALVLTLAASVLAATANRVNAADVIWDGTTGSFTEDTNWDTNLTPTAADNAIISNTGTAEIADGDAVDILSLQIDNGNIDQTGGTLNTNSAAGGDGLRGLNVGSASGLTGTYTASGGSEITGGAVRVGINGGTGVMDLSGSAVYNGVGGRDTWLGQGAGSNGTLNLSEFAEWHITGDALVVGRSGGTGTLNLTDDSKVTGAGNDIYLGAGANSTGNVNLSERAEISWAGGNIRAGQNGTTTITLEDSSKITATTGELWIANEGGSVATLNLNGNSRAEATNNWLVVGRNGGTGTATVAGTAQLVKQGGGQFGVGNGGGGNGTLTVKENGVASSNNDFRVGSEGGTGVLNVQDSASVSSGGQFWIGALNTNSNGTLNLSGGTVTSGSWIAVGRDGSKGVLNMTGGSLVHTATGSVVGDHFDGSNFVVNGSATNVAEVHHISGNIDNSNSVIAIGEASGNVAVWDATGGTATMADLRVGFSGNGTLNIGGTANYTTTQFYMGSNATGSGTLNLTGGTLTTNFISEGAGETNAVNFNGGVVKAGADSANFIEDFEAGEVKVLAGGLKFDTNNHVVTISHALTGAGGLTKQGAGELKLSGANDYTGVTEVQAGTLTLGASGVIADASAVTLAGGTLNLNNFDETLAALTLGSSSTIDFGSLGAGNTLVFADSSALTWTGTLTLTDFDFDSDVLNFSSVGGLTADQLNKIALAGYTATGLDGSGNVVFSAVPEPSTVALMVAGGFAVCFMARRRRSA